MTTIRLTDVTLKHLKVPNRGTLSYIDATLPGFAVRVSPSGVKAFTLVYGKERRRANLGRWPVVTIAKARKKAHDILAAHQLGLESDVLKMTLEEAFTLFLKGYEAKNRPKTVYEMKRLVKRHLMRKLKHRQVSSITTDDVASAIERIVSTPVECKSLYTAARTLFRWMERRSLVKISPLHHVESPTRPVSRAHVLTNRELGHVLAKAIAEPSSFGRIVELLIRTGQRVKQIAHLRAEWIDHDKKLITWPKEMMKAKREHTIPYPEAVAAILEKLPKRGFLFPARGKETPFNGFSKSKAAFDAGLEAAPYTLHDFRRNFSSECAALGVDPLTVERILAHAIPGVAGIYNRYSYLEPMRAAMTAYERYLQGLLAA